VKAITARASFVTEQKPLPVRRQSLRQLPDVVGAIRDRSPMSHFTAARPASDCHRNCCFVDVQSDERAIMCLVSPPFLRLGASSFWRNPRKENAVGEAAQPVCSPHDHRV
jgi:hypothetical protein